MSNPMPERPFGVRGYLRPDFTKSLSPQLVKIDDFFRDYPKFETAYGRRLFVVDDETVVYVQTLRQLLINRDATVHVLEKEEARLVEIAKEWQDYVMKFHQFLKSLGYSDDALPTPPERTA